MGLDRAICQKPEHLHSLITQNTFAAAEASYLRLIWHVTPEKSDNISRVVTPASYLQSAASSQVSLKIKEVGGDVITLQYNILSNPWQHNCHL